jgi:hypothetical protein
VLIVRIVTCRTFFTRSQRSQGRFKRLLLGETQPVDQIHMRFYVLGELAVAPAITLA